MASLAKDLGVLKIGEPFGQPKKIFPARSQEGS